MMMKQCLLLLAISLSNVFVNGQRSRMSLENNGYEKVVVAVHRTVAEDAKIVEEIKKIFTDASQYLFQATRQRAFFRNVTILIPDTWADNQTLYSTSVEERYITSDIRVLSPNTQFGDDPYTKQPGKCGEAGTFIHITPNFLLDPYGKREYTYGPAGRLLVHEFAHLRWGVFDEYGYKNNRKHPMFYTSSTGKVRPTGCTDKIKGVLLKRKTQQLCDIDRETSLPTKTCHFFADPINEGSISSVMYMQHLEKVVTFCESETSDLRIKHNAEAPNKHNTMCKSRGTWDIIQEHQDFAGGANPVRTDTVDTTPIFTLMYPRSSNRIVLVLDASGSMMDDNGIPVPRFYQLTQAFAKFMKDSVPTGTEVGVVTFSTRARIVSGMTPINDTNIRFDMTKLLDGVLVGGSTAIAEGVKAGIQMLGGDASGSKILVMTDGEEKTRPRNTKLDTPGFIQSVKDSGVVVDTLGFGKAASEKVERLATETGGQIFYYSENLESTVLDRALAKAVQQFGNTPYQVASYTTQFNSSDVVHNGVVNIDFFLGKKTKFVFSCPQNSIFNVTLTSPGGKQYIVNDTEYEYDSAHNMIRITLPEAEIGNWTYQLTTTEDLQSLNKTHNVLVDVKSFPPDDVTPIELQAWVNKVDIDFENDYPILYADVSQGQAPVINATVRAIVDRPKDGVVIVTLKDNGVGADSQEHDGVYTAYFTQVVGNGRYSVDMLVDNSQKNAATLFNGGGNSGAMKIWQNDTVEVQPKGLPYFTRTTIGGVFNLRNYTADSDPYPPNRITDLSVVKYSHMNQTVTLTFTAPGGDLDNGKAAMYVIKVAKTFEHIRNSFENKPDQFKDEHVREGSLQPDVSGTSQTITLKFIEPTKDDVLFFAVAAKDASGNMAEASNIVSSAIRYQGEDDIGLDVDKWAPIIAVGCAVFTIGLLLVIIGVSCYKHKKMMNKVSIPRNESAASIAMTDGRRV